MSCTAMKDIDHSNAEQIAPDGVDETLDELEHLLMRQADLLRRGQMREVEAMAGRTGELVGRMEHAGVFASVEFSERRADFERLYSNLRLGLSAERAKTAEQLLRVRKGMKTVSAYRRNM